MFAIIFFVNGCSYPLTTHRKNYKYAAVVTAIWETTRCSFAGNINFFGRIVSLCCFLYKEECLMRKFLLLSLTGMVFAGLMSLGLGNAHAGESVKIGVYYPMTGPSAVYGLSLIHI